MFTRGAILGRKYTLEETLGEGPTGPIFAAEERFPPRRVAIKVVRVPPSIKRRQFVRDADALQSVRSENVIFVHDVGTVDVAGETDTPYVVMELLEGRTLAELIAESGPLPLAEAMEYVLQACKGLDELHAARIVHRHVKPSNLFLTKGPSGEPRIKLLDVGVSSIELAIAAGDDPALDARLLDSLKYAPPERLLGSRGASTPSVTSSAAAADVRSDVWSLAVTLYVLATGTHPFSGATAAEVRDAIVHASPPRFSEQVPIAPEELDRVLERALAKELDARTPSIGDLARALEACMLHANDAAPPPAADDTRSADISSADTSSADAPSADMSSADTPSADAPSADASPAMSAPPEDASPVRGTPIFNVAPGDDVPIRPDAESESDSEWAPPAEPKLEVAPAETNSNLAAKPDSKAPAPLVQPASLSLPEPHKSAVRPQMWLVLAAIVILVIAGLSFVLRAKDTDVMEPKKTDVLETNEPRTSASSPAVPTLVPMPESDDAAPPSALPAVAAPRRSRRR